MGWRVTLERDKGFSGTLRSLGGLMNIFFSRSDMEYRRYSITRFKSDAGIVDILSFTPSFKTL